MLEWSGRIATWFICLCAAIVTAFVIRAEVAPRGLADPGWRAAQVPPAFTDHLIADTLLPDGAPLPLRVVEFGDFQCAFCAELRPVLDRIEAESKGRILVEFRHFPLQTQNPHAFVAAEAAQCASVRGALQSFVTCSSRIALSSARSHGQLLPDVRESPICRRSPIASNRVLNDSLSSEISCWRILWAYAPPLRFSSGGPSSRAYLPTRNSRQSLEPLCSPLLRVSTPNEAQYDRSGTRVPRLLDGMPRR